MKFQNRAEAAALLVALSRFLNSPRGDAHRSHVEIRGCARADAETELYVNREALAAISTAFLPLPPVAARSKAAVPSHAAVLLYSQTPGWGLDEAQSRLAQISH